MARRNTTQRPGSIGDTSRVPTIDHAPTLVYRPSRPSRPSRPPPVAVVEPDARGGPLAHPRLVRRTRPPTPAPTQPPAHAAYARRDGHELDEEPTNRCA